MGLIFVFYFLSIMNSVMFYPIVPTLNINTRLTIILQKTTNFNQKLLFVYKYIYAEH